MNIQAASPGLWALAWKRLRDDTVAKVIGDAFLEKRRTARLS